jgi:peptide deformylase
MILPVIQHPSPILNQISQPVTKFDGSLSSLVKNLEDTVKAENGIGISAIQCGIAKRVMLVSDNGRDFIVMVNPEVNYGGDFLPGTEGCLSYDKEVDSIYRPNVVFALWYDVNGNRHEEYFNGMLARVISHELAHLDGKGIWQYENI